jgi:hypothetical protein
MVSGETRKMPLPSPARLGPSVRTADTIDQGSPVWEQGGQHVKLRISE